MKKNIIYTSNGILGTNFSQEFIDSNIKEKSVIVIDNGTFDTRNRENRKANVEKFEEYGAKKVDLITINDTNTNCILSYDVCYMMGGSIANLLELVQITNIRDILVKFLEDGLYIGESAGSIILDCDVKWYFDLKRGTKPKYDRIFKSYQALGLIAKHIYPHANQEPDEKMKKIIDDPEKVELLEDGEYLQMASLTDSSIEKKPIKLIAKITDEDIGETSQGMKDNGMYRKGARGLVFNQEGKVAIFYKEKKNQYKLPGGGLEGNETFEEAFVREVREEIGCDVEIISCLGEIEEWKTKDNFRQVSRVFIGKVIKDWKQLQLTQMEQDEGGKVLWFSLAEALEKIESCYEHLRASNYSSIYSSKFVIKRDVSILKYYIEKVK